SVFVLPVVLLTRIFSACCQRLSPGGPGPGGDTQFVDPEIVRFLRSAVFAPFSTNYARHQGNTSNTLLALFHSAVHYSQAKLFAPLVSFMERMAQDPLPPGQCQFLCAMVGPLLPELDKYPDVLSAVR